MPWPSTDFGDDLPEVDVVAESNYWVGGNPNIQERYSPAGAHHPYRPGTHEPSEVGIARNGPARARHTGAAADVLQLDRVRIGQRVRARVVQEQSASLLVFDVEGEPS